MSKPNASHYQNFTNLEQWLYYLENLHSTEIDLGLTRIQQVADRLAINFSFATVITVAGTNGKGTTCAFLENALLDNSLLALTTGNLNEESTRTVAVYSSPHIERFNERLRINKNDVDDQSLIAAFNKIERAREEISLSYYEYTTLAAFLVLMTVKPDYIILEVGLGGRLDATNIIDADVAVITTIDLDHQTFLGNDRESIGFEKAGIMRSDQVIVIGDTNPPKSVLEHAYRLSGDNLTNLYIRNQQFTIFDDESSEHEKLTSRVWTWQSTQQLSKSINQLVATFIPRDNVATALMVLTSLGMSLDSNFINKIIKQTKVAGRTELFSQKEHCDVILDVGHNPQASRYLADYLQSIKQQGKYKKIHAVVAMLGDKDVSNSLSALSNDINSWNIGQLKVPRAATATLMAQYLREHITDDSNMINCFDNVIDAFKMANQQAELHDLILVFGSFYTVAEVRPLLLLDVVL